jgi:predicted metalloprotease with PDZ domain
MNPTRILVPALAATILATQAEAQQTRPRADAERARIFSWMTDDDRPRIGVATGPGGKRDTLGLLVTDVTRGGPAEKAGIEEGDRLQSVNGVNLRLSAADIEDEDLLGIGTRRLVRELGKVKVGDEVELRVYREGQARTVRVKTVSAEELQPERVTVSTRRREADERATLGIGLGTSGSRRDTMGILIASVTDDGPADKAKIEEGDRIAAINGVDLRVPAADAGDWTVSNNRMRRLTRELEKLKAGDEVELRLVRSGQARTVRVKTVAAKDLPGGSRRIFIGDGSFGFGDFPGAFGFGGPDGSTIRIRPRVPMGTIEPMIYFDRFDDGAVRMKLSPERRALIEERIGEVMNRIRGSQIIVRPDMQLP